MIYKRLKHLKYHLRKIPLKFLYLSTILSLVVFSCSVDKQELRKKDKINRNIKKSEKKANRIERKKLRKVDNDFSAYYNSYYLSKIKFKNALELNFRSNASETKSHSTNNSYFEEAIKYAEIVIEDFYNTKYINDAYYIKARSSYLKNILSPSSYYFKKILMDKENPYYFDALIHLGFISIQLDDLEQFEGIISELDINIDNFDKNISALNKKRPYKFLEDELVGVTSRYYLLKAEESIYFGRPESETEKYFLLSIDSSIEKNKIINIYRQILNLYKSQNNIDNIFKYLSILLNEFPSNEVDSQLEEDWFYYGRIIGDYGQILDYVERKLNQALSVKEKIFYLIEMSKTYSDMGELYKSENMLKMLLEDYEQYTSTYKQYFANIYYELGLINLHYYMNFEESLNYFSLAKEKDNLNLKAKNYANALSQYIELSNTYYENSSKVDTANTSVIYSNLNYTSSKNDTLNNSGDIFYIPLPEDYKFTLNNNFDTLLFNMASVLHFNLGLDSLSVDKLELIYYENVESTLIPQVISLLERINPDTNWNKNFSDNNQLSQLTKDLKDNIEITKKRSLAFNNMNTSLYKSIEQFENIFNEYSDWSSLYMVGYIYDYYIGDLIKAVEYYKKYIENKDSEKFIQVKSRLSAIEDLVVNQNKFIKQKITYLNAISYIDGTFFDIDTLSNDLKECKKGPNRLFNEKCSELLEVIEFPSPKKISDSLLINVVDKWSNGMKMDKRLFTVANIINEETANSDLAKDYYKLIIDYYSNSEYIYEVFLDLKKIDDLINWDASLTTYIQDKYNLIDDYKVRTGSDIISAINNRLYPLDFTSTNQIFEVYLDSINSVINTDDYFPSEIYDVSFKENVIIGRKNSKENYLISLKSSEIGDYEEYFSITDNKLMQWEDNFEVARELSPESYLLSPNIIFIKSSLNNIQMKDRYNINNTETDCIYLNNNLKCYEVEVIPSENDYYKNLLVLKIEKNQYLLVREQSFDLNGNIINQLDFEYKSLGPYYMLNKVIGTDFKNKFKRIQLIKDISLNNGLSDSIFIFNKENNWNNNRLEIDDLYLESNRLDSIYNLLFFIPETIDTVSIIDTLNDQVELFPYNQSINQYFYFVEDASIEGAELTNQDWLVSYNNDIIVGARRYKEGGMIDIPIMGYDDSSDNTKISTEGYCQIGDRPNIKVFRSNGEFVSMEVVEVEGDLEFKSLGHATVILKKD